MDAGHFAFSKLVVGDLEKSAAFYEAVFGLKQQARIDAALVGRALTEIVYEPTAKGASNFVLLAFHDTPRPAGGETITGLLCQDLDAAVERAVAGGGSVLQPAFDLADHGLRIAILADPEGHMIELIKPL